MRFSSSSSANFHFGILTTTFLWKQWLLTLFGQKYIDINRIGIQIIKMTLLNGLGFLDRWPSAFLVCNASWVWLSAAMDFHIFFYFLIKWLYFYFVKIWFWVRLDPNNSLLKNEHFYQPTKHTIYIWNLDNIIFDILSRFKQKLERKNYYF